MAVISVSKPLKVMRLQVSVNSGKKPVNGGDNLKIW